MAMRNKEGATSTSRPSGMTNVGEETSAPLRGLQSPQGKAKFL